MQLIFVQLVQDLFVLLALFHLQFFVFFHLGLDCLHVQQFFLLKSLEFKLILEVQVLLLLLLEFLHSEAAQIYKEYLMQGSIFY